MRVFFNPQQASHDPEAMMFRGKKLPFPECSERLTLLQEGLSGIGLTAEIPTTHKAACLTAVHDPGYIDFLRTGYDAWARLKDASPEIVPNTHPGRHMSHRPEHVVGLAGFYLGDQACPIGSDTWAAINASADTALSTVELVVQGASVAYGLCRPPGHHAFSDVAGGFCYVNNVAVAAQRALDLGAEKVAILDVDVHHGNGTQSIFYDRDDVLFVSLHGDPSGYYPFFAGYEDETGVRGGEGYNFNFPMPIGTGDQAFLATLDIALDKVRNFAPDVLLISLGLDTQADDPIGIFKITLDGFAKLGAAIAGLGQPSAIIQEGGYVCDLLGQNLARFLTGFSDGQAN